MNTPENSEEFHNSWQKFTHSYLKQGKWLKTLHSFESDTQIYFDIEFFKSLFLEANWQECLGYIECFLSRGGSDRQLNFVIYFTICKEMYLWALHRNDLHAVREAMDKIVRTCRENDNLAMVTELQQLLWMKDFRIDEKYEKWMNDAKYRQTVWDKSLQSHLLKLLKTKLNISTLTTIEACNMFQKSLERANETLKLEQRQHSSTPSSGLKSKATENGERKDKDEKSGKDAEKKESESTVESLKRKLKATDTDKQGKRAKNEDISPSTSPRPRLTESDKKKSTVDISSIPKALVVRVSVGKSTITAAAFHPKLPHILLLGCSNPNSLFLVDIKSGLVLSKYCLEPYKKPVLLSWAPTNDYFGVAYEEYPSFNVFLTKSQKLIELAPGWQYNEGNHTGPIRDLKFDMESEQPLLATGSADSRCKIWDITKGVLNCEFKSESPVISLCWLFRNGKRLVCVTNENEELSIFILNKDSTTVEAPRFSKKCPQAVGRISDLWVMSGRFFACGSGENCLIEIGSKDASVERHYGPFKNEGKNRTRFCAINNLIAVGDGDRVKFWDCDCVEVLDELVLDDKKVHLVHLSMDTSLLLVICENLNSIYIYASPNKAFPVEKKVITVLESESIDVSERARKKLLPVEATSLPSNAPFVPASSREKKAALSKSISNTSKPYSSSGTSPIVSPSAPLSLTASVGTTIPPSPTTTQTFTIAEGLELDFDEPNIAIVRLCYSATGNSIMGLNEKGTNLSWKWSTITNPGTIWASKNPPINVKCEDGAVPTLSLSSNGAFFLCSYGHQLELFNNLKRTLIKLIHETASLNYVSSAKFDPADNNFFAVGTSTGEVMIRNARSKSNEPIKGHSGVVTDLLFLKQVKDEGFIFSAGSDGKVVLWSVKLEPPKINKMDIIQTLSVSSPNINLDLSLSPSTNSKSTLTTPSTVTPTGLGGEGRYLLVSQKDQLQVWKDNGTLESGEVMTKIATFSDFKGAAVVSASFNSDGSLIFVVLDSSKCLIFGTLLDKQGEIDLNYKPTALATHPTIPLQIAIGSSTGLVYVLRIQTPEI